MICKGCKCVFFMVLSPEDDGYGNPAGESIYCPRCAAKGPPSAFGSKPGMSWEDGFQKVLDEIEEQQAPARKGNQ